MNERKDRPGTSFERLVADMFNRIGFNVELNVFTNKESGQKSEQDVLAEKEDLKILVQCKDYAKFPDTKMEETIQDLIEDGNAIGAEKLVLAIIGLKDINKWMNYTRQKGIYLWNENYWRKLQRIETNQELKKEIGKNLQLPESFVSEKQMIRLINSAGISKTEKQKLLKEIPTFRNEEELEDEIKHLELKEKLKSNLETGELEEVDRLIDYYDFDYHHKYLVYKKIKSEVDLSEDPKRILTFEQIKTYIDKTAVDIYGKNEGSKYLIEVYEKWRGGKISKKSRDKLSKEIIVKLGVHKKSEIEVIVIDLADEIKKAEIRIKLYKTLIAIGLWTIISFVLWRILF